MKILIVGAGATGGAFGTLLQEAGREVTYLVREQRARQLRAYGLRYVSPGRDRTHQVSTLIAGESAGQFDLILIAVKAFAIRSVIDDIRPYVSESTSIMPILNGMSHFQTLEQEFPGQIVGGLARIIATLNGNDIHQLADMSGLTLGALTPEQHIDPIAEALRVPGIDLAVSDDIMKSLWEKWTFIAAAGVATCLFRAPIGATIDAGGLPYILSAVSELEAVAEAAGYPVSPASHEFTLSLLTAEGSSFTSSLYRDFVDEKPHEGEQILGDFARQAREVGLDTPLLDLTLVKVRAGDLARTAYRDE